MHVLPEKGQEKVREHLMFRAPSCGERPQKRSKRHCARMKWCKSVENVHVCAACVCTCTCAFTPIVMCMGASLCACVFERARFRKNSNQGGGQGCLAMSSGREQKGREGPIPRRRRCDTVAGYHKLASGTRRTRPLTPLEERRLLRASCLPPAVETAGENLC